MSRDRARDSANRRWNKRALPLMAAPDELAEPYVLLADLLEAGGGAVVRYGAEGPLLDLNGETFEVILKKGNPA
jgi:hypothetical protein